MAHTDDLRAYLRERRDPDQFRFKPWQPERISPLALLDQIEEAIEQHGYWDTYGEFRMAAGPIVRIEPVDAETGRTYVASADWGVTIRGEYETLDQALGALSVFALLVWDMDMAGFGDGLVWHPVDLPWPPGPR